MKTSTELLTLAKRLRHLIEEDETKNTVFLQGVETLVDLVIEHFER